MPTPEQLADADLSSIGLPAARQQALRAYARAVLDGNERLEGIPGIGPWTRAYYAMRALADPDAFPAGDLVLRKAAHCTEKELTQRAEAWRPWRAYAAVHLWRSQA
jgi:AraC family transcriptional regulator of adaptative response / DNA-3-methyladenine glycosylase II